MIRLERAQYLGNNRNSYFLDGLVVNETEYKNKVSEDWHYHVNNHITLFLEGGNCEQRKETENQALPGKVFLYPAGILHRNRHTALPSRNLNFEIEENFLARFNLEFSVNANCDVIPNLLKVYKECLVDDLQSQASTIFNSEYFFIK